MFIVCWDYDGTLVSSELIYKNIFVDYLKKIGATVKDITDDYYFKKYAGRHPFTVIEQLKSDGYVKQNVTINTDDLNKIFQNSLSKNNDLILTKNIANLLNNISKINNSIMAIVTSTFRIDFMAKHTNPSVLVLRDYFDIDKNIYLCGEIGSKALKPDPNGYLYAYKDIISKNKIEKQNNCLVMIEDSVSGCQAAASAKKLLKNCCPNITVIGYTVANKYVTSTGLKEAGADYVVGEPEELQNLLMVIEKNALSQVKYERL